jgi:hypothetical protein
LGTSFAYVIQVKENAPDLLVVEALLKSCRPDPEDLGQSNLLNQRQDGTCMAPLVEYAVPTLASL